MYAKIDQPNNANRSKTITEAGRENSVDKYEKTAEKSIEKYQYQKNLHLHEFVDSNVDHDNHNPGKPPPHLSGPIPGQKSQEANKHSNRRNKMTNKFFCHMIFTIAL